MTTLRPTRPALVSYADAHLLDTRVAAERGLREIGNARAGSCRVPVSIQRGGRSELGQCVGAAILVDYSDSWTRLRRLPEYS